LWLFGSRARDEADGDSDFDMLAIAEGDAHEIRGIVREVEWQCMQTWGRLVASIVYTPEIWEIAKDSPLGLNIQREGKLVA
jgi:predicted nucleotidyltransferase